MGLGAHSGLAPPELFEGWVEEAVDVAALAARLREARVVGRPEAGEE